MKCSLLVLSSYLDGELEARREGELEAHLVGCQRCRAGLGYLREEVERVSALGRVHVAEHSVHALLGQLGLIDAGEEMPERDTAIALAEPPPGLRPAWMGGDDATTLPWSAPAEAEESKELTGFPGAMTSPPLPAEPTAEPPSATPPAEATEPPPFRWVPAEKDVSASSASLHAPPPTAGIPDTAPSAPSGGAFPPGGPEHVDPSESSTHAPAPGGEPEMTASPPWAPHDTATEPLYPMTDDDVLDAPMQVDRFGPPLPAARPSLFERLRDRFAVRRALSRSSSAYEDQVQIISGLGAPLRPGRARLEVERRRQETLRMDPGGIPDEAIAGFDVEEDDVDPELGLGPLPPLPTQFSSTPMPRPPSRPVVPGQMALPGTSITDPRRPPGDETVPPVHRVPMPPPRHTLGSALGEAPTPTRPPLPPLPPLPPATPLSPPAPPVPDLLGEALSEYDREPGTVYEPRPWRPRDLAGDHPAAPPVSPTPRRFAPAPPDAAERQRPSPSQLRDGRRLLALFGAATLVMFIVGIVSGRTTSPRPASSTAPSATAPAPAHSQPSTSQKRSSSSSQTVIAPNPQASQAPGGTTPQLTGAKVLGDSGSGYQVKDFRYGVHPGDFRIVLDLDASGAASGTPKATVGLLDPTTLLVVLDGVVPAGSTGQLPSSNPVSAVTLLQQSPFPGATTYQIKLAHPVSFSAGYVTGPLRLVIDLAA